MHSTAAIVPPPARNTVLLPPRPLPAAAGPGGALTWLQNSCHGLAQPALEGSVYSALGALVAACTPGWLTALEGAVLGGCTGLVFRALGPSDDPLPLRVELWQQYQQVPAMARRLKGGDANSPAFDHLVRVVEPNVASLVEDFRHHCCQLGLQQDVDATHVARIRHFYLSYCADRTPCWLATGTPLRPVLAATFGHARAATLPTKVDSRSVPTLDLCAPAPLQCRPRVVTQAPLPSAGAEALGALPVHAAYRPTTESMVTLQRKKQTARYNQRHQDDTAQHVPRARSRD